MKKPQTPAVEGAQTRRRIQIRLNRFEDAVVALFKRGYPAGDVPRLAIIDFRDELGKVRMFVSSMDTRQNKKPGGSGKR